MGDGNNQGEFGVHLEAAVVEGVIGEAGVLANIVLAEEAEVAEVQELVIAGAINADILQWLQE